MSDLLWVLVSSPTKLHPSGRVQELYIGTPKCGHFWDPRKSVLIREVSWFSGVKLCISYRDKIKCDKMSWFQGVHITLLASSCSLQLSCWVNDQLWTLSLTVHQSGLIRYHLSKGLDWVITIKLMYTYSPHEWSVSKLLTQFLLTEDYLDISPGTYSACWWIWFSGHQWKVS